MLTPEFFHNLIVKRHDDFMVYLDMHCRGLWSPLREEYVEHCLSADMYKHLKLVDIKKALREVAMQPYGLLREPRHLDAFSFCHKMGFFHTEEPMSEGKEVKFTFASPLHRRVAYRRLFPGREPDAVIRDQSLQKVCTNAIARFSPGALQNRRDAQSNRGWGIPEAAFQEEMYSCLSLELHYLPILSQYTYTRDGRIDFYVESRKWGIEILQCGSNTDLAKHIARFEPGGNYHNWDIMDEYIVLNFCSRSAFLELKTQGTYGYCLYLNNITTNLCVNQINRYNRTSSMLLLNPRNLVRKSIRMISSCISPGP